MQVMQFRFFKSKGAYEKPPDMPCRRRSNLTMGKKEGGKSPVMPFRRRSAQVEEAPGNAPVMPFRQRSKPAMDNEEKAPVKPFRQRSQKVQEGGALPPTMPCRKLSLRNDELRRQSLSSTRLGCSQNTVLDVEDAIEEADESTLSN